MKRCLKLIMTGLMLASLCAPALAADKAKVPAAEKPKVDAAYVIGAGDVLFISVWKDEALTKNVTVTPDGRVSFPLIGEVKAAGLNVADLGAAMRQKLERFVPDAEINIAVQQANSQAVFVLGEVARPGRYPLIGPLSTLQALALAGGFTPYAKENSIKVFRNEGGQAKVIKIKYRSILSGKKPDGAILSGDVIVVP